MTPVLLFKKYLFVFALSFPPDNFIWCSFPVCHLHLMPNFTGFCHILSLQSYFPILKSHSVPFISLISLFCIFSGFTESFVRLLSRNPELSLAAYNCNSLCTSVSWSCLWAQPRSDQLDRRRPPLMPPWGLTWRAWHKRRLFLFCSPSICLCRLSTLVCSPWPPKSLLTWKEVSLTFVVHFSPILMNKEWVHLWGGTCKGKAFLGSLIALGK